MTIITKKEITNLAKQVKEYVEKNYAIPSQIGTTRHGEYTYLFCRIIMANGLKDLQHRGVASAPNPSGDTIHGKKIYRTHYIQMAKTLAKYVETNNKLPNNLTWDKYKVHMHLYEYAFAKIVVYMSIYGQTPNYVAIDSNAFVKPAPPKNYSQQILEYFEGKFGKVTTIDGALAKIKGNGYGYYYDDMYSNKTSIDRMKNGYGVNCTDSCHVFWHIGKALGYDVRCVHVKCRGGDGHVKLQFKNSKYPNWFERDPAAVLDGECTECVWCSNGTILAYNPAWFTANLNR